MKSHKSRYSKEEDIINQFMNNGLITGLFYTFIILALNYFNKLNRIGKFETIYLVVIIILFDIIKSWKLPFTTKPEKTEKKYFLQTAVLILLSVLTYAMIAIAFGAPILTNHEETLMFAIVLTALTTVHSLIYIGYKNTVSLLLGLTNFNGNLCITEVTLRDVQCTLIGAWAGAVVIPLDWNRPWQEWPIPCTFSAFMGFIIGHLIQILLAVISRQSSFKKNKQFV